MKNIIRLIALSLFVSTAFAQRELGVRPTETGGPLMPEQAAFDVKRYDLNINVDFAKKSISGDSTMTANIVHPTNVIVLDLDTPYTVSRVQEPCGGKACELKFERRGGKIWISLPTTRQAGEKMVIQVFYSGTPREAPRPRGSADLFWTKTPTVRWFRSRCKTTAPIFSFRKGSPSIKPTRSNAGHVPNRSLPSAGSSWFDTNINGRDV